MKKINWNEKPDWAIGHAVVKQTNKKVWFSDTHYQYLSDGNKYMFISGFTPDDLIDKQSPPQWSDEGLPLVGTVCEMLVNDNPIGDSVLIMGYYDDLVWVTVQSWDDRGYYSSSYYDTFILAQNLTFRPIKSDKEKWVEQAMKCCDPDYGQLYDALISGELPIPKGVKK